MVLIEGKHSPSLLQCRTRTCSTSRALGFSSEENARCIYSNFAIFQSSQSCLTVTGAFLLQYTSPPAVGRSVRWLVSQTGRGIPPQSAHLPQRAPYSIPEFPAVHRSLPGVLPTNRTRPTPCGTPESHRAEHSRTDAGDPRHGK